jgi:hypothetical protein
VHSEASYAQLRENLIRDYNEATPLLISQQGSLGPDFPGLLNMMMSEYKSVGLMVESFQTVGHRSGKGLFRLGEEKLGTLKVFQTDPLTHISTSTDLDLFCIEPEDDHAQTVANAFGGTLDRSIGMCAQDQAAFLA